MNMIYPHIKLVNSERVKTKAAAHYLQKDANTLRRWSCGSVPLPVGLKPVKVGHHLLWSVAEIKKLLGVAA